MTALPAGGIVLDLSAAVAIITGEQGYESLDSALEGAPVRLMSAATRVELAIVIESRLGPAGVDVVDRFIREAGLDLVDVDGEAVGRAIGAWRRYGKGRHPAGLNFGDCFTYALAERTGFRVACTGGDFAATDLDVIRPSVAG